MPPTDRPKRLSESTSFTITIAVLISIIGGSVSAGAVWSSHQAAVSDHETRIKRVETQLEDFASIKTDVAVMKAILERIERRQRHASSTQPE